MKWKSDVRQSIQSTAGIATLDVQYSADLLWSASSKRFGRRLVFMIVYDWQRRSVSNLYCMSPIRVQDKRNPAHWWLLGGTNGESYYHLAISIRAISWLLWLIAAWMHIQWQKRKELIHLILNHHFVVVNNRKWVMNASQRATTRVIIDLHNSNVNQSLWGLLVPLPFATKLLLATHLGT